MRLTEEQPALLGYCINCGMPVFVINGEVRWQECELGEFCQVDPLVSTLATRRKGGEDI